MGPYRIGCVALVPFLFTAAWFPAYGQERDIPVIPDRTANEIEWNRYFNIVLQDTQNGTLPDGSSVDILTSQTAWEVDWADKWKEAVGQSLFYSLSTGRAPGIWLLKRGMADDEYYLRCLLVVMHLRSKGISVEFRVTDVHSTRQWDNEVSSD